MTLSRLVVARVGRAHGIRGEVTVQLHTDAPDRRFTPGAVLHVVAPAPGLPARLTVQGHRNHNGTTLLTFTEITDRTAAEALRGVRLEAEVDVGVADPAEPDAWYDHELVGLAVLDRDGARLGTVSAVEHLPAQDLLEVRRPDGSLRLVPFVSAIVPEVDVPGGRVVVDAPPGLLDDPVEDPAGA